MTTHPSRIMPLTSLGKWSVWLIIAMPVLFVTGTFFTNSLYPSVPAGNTIMEDLAARPALALSMLAGMIAGVSAFITGVLAIVRHKDRTLLVVASSVVGALVVVFLTGEFLFPH